MLHINKLTKHFGATCILNECTITVKKGEIALLVGPSGVGKSTLLRILNNLESYESGTILFNGKDLKELHKQSTPVTGLVFQQWNLFENLTVEQNITVPLEKVLLDKKEQAQEIAHALLKKYELESKAKSPVNQLSGGQKQRLAIARALALNPHIICLDEPTSALDPQRTASVAITIQELAAKGFTVLVTSHDTSLIKQLDCTIHLMEKGTIIESASSAQFMQDPTKYPHILQFTRLVT